jgi:hypothetical protein
MKRQDELAAIAQFLSVSQVSRCPTVYVAPTPNAVSLTAEEEARRLKRIVLPQTAVSPWATAKAPRGGARGGRTSEDFTKAISAFFARAQLTETFSVADIARHVFRTENPTQTERDTLRRALSKSLPADWRVTILPPNRYVCHHASNLP